MSSDLNLKINQQIQLKNSADSLLIIKTWRTRGNVFIILGLGIAWLFGQPDYFEAVNNFNLPNFAILLFSIASLVSIIYFGFAVIFNKTTICLTPEKLSVEHKPLAWFGAWSIQTNHIQSLSINQTINKSNEIMYEIFVFSDQHGHKKLMNLNAASEAEQILDAIKAKLAVIQ